MPPSASLAPHVGNAYDKYASGNPLAALLTRRFLGEVDELLGDALADALPHAARRADELPALSTDAPCASLLDVGCGEGVLSQRWARRWPELDVLAVDRERVVAEWNERAERNVRFDVADACALPFADGEFDVACGIELLEQVAAAEVALAELVRVARRAVLVSVPREPLWRVLNVLRGAYVGWLGNPPGHVNHYSRRAFVSLAARHGRVREVRCPLPWTIVLIDVAR
ncbi:MAG TPA: class I SAM-dependent methyltransferase [Solirubrobacteraceae bacterium]|nr:class I SAM-dependent methyltransferase [Solirubrobacteraceae bacterium]